MKTDYLTFIKTFKKLDDLRWELVEKKYKTGLTADEHVRVDWLASWTRHHRVYVRGDHEYGHHKVARA